MLASRGPLLPPPTSSTPAFCMSALHSVLRRTRSVLARLSVVLLLLGAVSAQAQPFEEETHDVGNIGFTVTNAGFYGNSAIKMVSSALKSICEMLKLRKIVGMDFPHFHRQIRGKSTG